MAVLSGSVRYYEYLMSALHCDDTTGSLDVRCCGAPKLRYMLLRTRRPIRVLSGRPASGAIARTESARRRSAPGPAPSTSGLVRPGPRLSQRLPDLRLASDAALPLRPANFVSGLVSMPVVFSPSKPSSQQRF